MFESCIGDHYADVVELVETLDLGSSAEKAWEFESPYPHQ